MIYETINYQTQEESNFHFRWFKNRKSHAKFYKTENICIILLNTSFMQTSF
jgi:hypothetical protein